VAHRAGSRRRGARNLAFEAKTGKKLWAFKAGGPILHTAGVEGGRVFLGCLDGCVYALDARTGEVAWKSDTLYGAAFKDYWPVVYKDYALVRPAKVSSVRPWKPIEWLHGSLPEAELEKQKALLDAFEKDPAEKNLGYLTKAQPGI